MVYYRSLHDSSSLTAASCPFRTAHHSGVRPSASFESGSTLSVASSSLTTASCPLAAAYDSGVRPSLVRELISTFLVASRTFTRARSPSSAAYERRVRSFRELISRLFLRRYPI